MYELSVIVFSLMFALLLLLAKFIYNKVGWIPCLIFALVLVFGPLPTFEPYRYTYNPVMSGLQVAHGFFCFACVSIFAWRAFVIHAHRDEYDQYVNEKIGTPTDEDLIKQAKPWLLGGTRL